MENKRRLLKSKCTQPCSITRTGNRFIQTLYDQLPAFALLNCLDLTIHSHQIGIWGNTGKRSCLDHLHNPNTVKNLRCCCTVPSITTSERTVCFFVFMFAHWCLILMTEGFAFRKKPLYVHYQAEEGCNSPLKLQNNESSLAASLSA